MLSAYTTSATVGAGAPIPFNNVIISKGCAETLSGANTVVIKKCGVYEVIVTASSISETATGSVAIQLYKNGVAYSAPISETVGDATSTHSLAVNALVQVPQNDCKCNACTSPTVLTVQNVGNAATVTMNVTVNKIA